MPPSLALDNDPRLPERVLETLEEIRATGHGALKDSAEISQLVNVALHFSGISQKEFCYYSGASKSHVSSVLRGVGNVPLQWLWALPEDFWRSFLPMVARAKGVQRSEKKRAAVRKVVDAIQCLALALEGDEE